MMKGSGLQHKEIASALGIHRRTVEAHLSSAKSKLGAKTCMHTVVLAIKKGIIGLGEIGLVLVLCWSCFDSAIDARRGPRVQSRSSSVSRRETIV